MENENGTYGPVVSNIDRLAHRAVTDLGFTFLLDFHLGAVPKHHSGAGRRPCPGESGIFLGSISEGW